MQFSLIVPVYNVEKYLRECLESIHNQSYENFEAIVIDDGSTDNSYKIMEEFADKDKRFKIFSQKNSGLSVTRNKGIKMAKGDFYLLVDSDDKIDENLLSELATTIEKDKDVDLIRFRINKIDLDNNEKIEDNNYFSNLNGGYAFLKLYQCDLFVSPVAYAYRTKFVRKNNFSYAKGRVHEDFGLTPFIVLKAEKVTSIQFVGYYYYTRENSIMMTNTKEKLKKKNEDTLYHYDNLIKMTNTIKMDEYVAKIFYSYISNALINRAIVIKDKEMLKDYVSELKKRKIYKYLIDDTLMRKMKKLTFMICPYFYVRVFVR